MANVRQPIEGPMSPGGEYPETAGMTRRETLANGAKLVVAAGIGAQIMAATGADTAIAKQVRSVASRAGNKPGYGPLVKNGPLRVPAGFSVFEFGKAGTPMSDGNRTPKHHDGSTLFDAGNGRLTMIRNQERAGFGKSISKHNAYDRHAKAGVTTSLFDTGTGELIGSSLVLNGTDNNCNGGVTPWGTWLSGEENTVGKEQGYGAGYAYDHDADDGFSGANYWPDEMEPQTFYSPANRGFEAKVLERLAFWEEKRRERQEQD